MPFDGTSSGGKCYGAGRRRLSPGSFQKGSENRKGLKSNDFCKETDSQGMGKTERSRLCERFFVYILHAQADLYSLVFSLDIQTFYRVLFAQVYSVRMTPIYLLLSHHDSFVNMIRTRV